MSSKKSSVQFSEVIKQNSILPILIIFLYFTCRKSCSQAKRSMNPIQKEPWKEFLLVDPGKGAVEGITAGESGKRSCGGTFCRWSQVKRLWKNFKLTAGDSRQNVVEELQTYCRRFQVKGLWKNLLQVIPGKGAVGELTAGDSRERRYKRSSCRSSKKRNFKLDACNFRYRSCGWTYCRWFQVKGLWNEFL